MFTVNHRVLAVLLFTGSNPQQTTMTAEAREASVVAEALGNQLWKLAVDMRVGQ